ncbi:CotD family spore coat protein [Bacillus cereus]
MRNYCYSNQQLAGAFTPNSPFNNAYGSPQQINPTQTLPAQYNPVQQNTTTSNQDVIIPVVHPSHTTHVNQTNYKYVHSFPHTESVVNQTTQQHLYSQPTNQTNVAPSPFCSPCNVNHPKWF